MPLTPEQRPSSVGLQAAATYNVSSRFRIFAGQPAPVPSHTVSRHRQRLAEEDPPEAVSDGASTDAPDSLPQKRAHLPRPQHRHPTASRPARCPTRLVGLPLHRATQALPVRLPHISQAAGETLTIGLASRSQEPRLSPPRRSASFHRKVSHDA